MAMLSLPAFAIEYMQPADFSTIVPPSHCRGGDLTTPPISPLCWLVRDGDDAEALRRLQYSCLQHQAWFERDPTAHCLKAVHPENREIVSIARWNFFPNAYDFERNEVVDVAEFAAEGTLKENGGAFNLELWREFRTGTMRKRVEWMTAEKPCWVLMSMVTRESYRKQGAAAQLIDWGCQKAREDCVPAYLEASAAGKPVYEKYGFRQIGELTRFDCRPYDKEVIFNLAKMAYYPEDHPNGSDRSAW